MEPATDVLSSIVNPRDIVVYVTVCRGWPNIHNIDKVTINSYPGGYKTFLHLGRGGGRIGPPPPILRLEHLQSPPDIG